MIKRMTVHIEEITSEYLLDIKCNSSQTQARSKPEWRKKDPKG